MKNFRTILRKKKSVEDKTVDSMELWKKGLIVADSGRIWKVNRRKGRKIVDQAYR
jgi:hypothetical protein